MASRFALLTTIVLDASGYNKGINQVSQQTKEMASTLKEAGNGVTETLGKMGGLTSEIGASVGELAGAATGIGLVVAAISVLINYLKIAKENMDKYLESADKAKGGTGMFFEDAQTLQKETTKRARGGVTADQDIMTKSFLQLNRVQKEINAETDQAKKNELIDLRTQLFDEYQSAKLQKVINEDIKAGSTGYKNRIRIQAAARILLLEEKKLEEDKNKSLEGFIKNEGELVRLRTVILSKTTTEAEKEKAMTDYAALAKTQLDAKTSLIEREISLTEQRGKLTFTEHDSEEKILKLNADKAELGKTYNTQLLKAERDQNRILASEQKALAAKEKAQKVEADFQDTKTNLHQKVIIDEQKTEMDTALQTRTFKYMNDKKELEEKYKGHKDLEILLKDMETAYMIEMADIKQEYYDKDVEAKKKAEEKK